MLTALAACNFDVAGRCLDGPSLLAQANEVDAVLASADLHRLTVDSLEVVRHSGTPLVLLVEPAEIAQFEGLAYLAPAASSGTDIVSALRGAIQRGVIQEATSATERQSEEASAPLAHGGQVLALVSGKGAPGTTTLAISLASALGHQGSRVVLVDADLRGGGVAPYLDLDPRRGLIGLTVGPPSDDVVGAELQDASGFSVLAGIERPEMRDRATPEHLLTALAVLRQRFEVTVVDVGQLLPGLASDAANAVTRSADQVLVVTTADLTGLWNTRHCLRFLQESLGLPRERLALLISRHAGRQEYGGAEVERALGVRVLAMIPDDRKAALRAAREQLPLTAVGGSPARQVNALAVALTRPRVAPEERQSDTAPRSRWRRRTAEAGQ
ncbi:MAG: P-loop NTPase [Chloroflexi bacterium]|nr:P-loop NTPase [Chloroflexota bacterium]